MVGFRPCPAFLFLAIVVLLARVATGKGDALVDVARRVPTEVEDLQMVGEESVYEGEGIFAYLNGGGEIYLAYGMRACLAREYARPDASFIVDVFDMGSATDAFGVFGYDQDGATVAVGQDALLRPGWLSFWKGRFFVSITADNDDDAAQQTILALGRAVSSAIVVEGEPPELLKRLPAEGLVPRSARYLHHPVILRSFMDLGDDNPFALAGDAEAVLARYRRGEESAAVLLVRYDDGSAARAARERAGQALLASWPNESAQQGEQGGWRALRCSGEELALVTEASGPDVARALLAELLPDSDEGG